MNRRNAIHLLLLFVFSGILIAQQLNIIELRHRQAEELIPTIRPLLKENEGISGQGYELYLNASAETAQNIRKLITRLDKAPAQLLISLRNFNIGTDNQSGTSISGSLNHGNVQLTAGATPIDDSVTIQASSSLSATIERQQPQIRATEGEPVLIYAGSSVPITIKDRRYRNGRIIERGITDYRPLQSGFYVTAWVNGENVRLEIDQKDDSLQNSGAINVSSIKTSAQGRLGEWITIGGIDLVRRNSSINSNSKTAVSTETRNTVSIRVEKLNQPITQ